MVWQGVPEVICHGTPTEIGHCHGTVAKDRIHTSIKNYAALYEETAQMQWSQARSSAAEYVPTLKRLVPEIVEEMEAIAEGAGVDFLDIVALNVRSEISLTNFPDEAPDGCTSLGQSPTDGSGTVFVAQNWDWTAEAADATVIFDIRRTTDGTPRIQMFGEAGLVAKFGFNDKGLGLCMNAIKSGSVDKQKLPVHVAERKALETGSFPEAKAVLDKFGVASCIHFAIADREGQLGSIECTPLGNFLMKPGSEGTVCHSNHLISQDIPKQLKDDPAPNSYSRLARIRELSIGVKPSFESIRKRLSDEENSPLAICRSAPQNSCGMASICTLSTMIIDLKNMRAELSLGRPSLSPPIKVLTM